MLFVSLAKTKPGSATRDRLARRVQWQYPPGARVLGEYWLQTEDPVVIVVMESDEVTPLMQATADWDDCLEITTVPAMAAEQGLKFAEQLGAAARA